MTPRSTTCRESTDELLRNDHYTPEDLAELLGMDVSSIRRAARTGELPAFIVDHHVLCIRRDDVIRWLGKYLGHE